MNYNYHTHTYLCGHATEVPEEYVLRAIENGIKYMGFSDHIPLKYPDGFEASFRVKEEDALKYSSEISRLKEKYKDKIDIKIGFEMEYFEDLFDEMFEKAISYGAEYLILGQHYYKHENLSDTKHINDINDSASDLKEYVNSVIKAIKTGVFSYVAHPDMFNFVGDEQAYKAEMKRLLDAVKEYNIPVEINCMGIRGKRCYPNALFWELAGKIGVPVTIGFDAHNAMSAYDKESIKIAEEIIDKYGLNYVGMPEIVDISNN